MVNQHTKESIDEMWELVRIDVQDTTYLSMNAQHRLFIKLGKEDNGVLKYKVIFDGTVVKSTKTFAPVQKKANELIKQYDLIRDDLPF